MYLDESLDFEYHISKLYSKTCSKVGLLKKIRMKIDHSTALTLYKSLAPKTLTRNPLRYIDLLTHK